MRKPGKTPSTAATFLLVALIALVALIGAWWGVEALTPYRLQPQPLRIGMFGLLVAVSLGAGALVARRVVNGAAAANRDPLEGVPEVDPDRLSRLAKAARANEDPMAQSGAPDAEYAEPDDPAAPAVIEAARHRPIVFREAFPPVRGQVLSHYGGVPSAPAGFAWPRFAFEDGERPLTFMMQWDCRELAGQDVTGLLPRDGLLQFYVDLRWQDMDAFRFIHVPGDPSGWQPIEPPADLPPLYGDQTAWMVRHCSRHLPAGEQACPVLLPRWPFTPLAFDYPVESEEDWFWSENSSAERLIQLQNSLGDPPVGYHPGKTYQDGPRPFPAFPHDWAAVRIACATVLDTLTKPLGRLPDSIGKLDDAAREARIAEIKAEAAELYTFAAGHPLGGKVPADLSDQIWEWLAPLNGLYFASQLAKESANTSLGLGSDAAGAIPAELLDAVWSGHALGLAYMRDEYAHEYLKRCGDGVERSEAERRYAEEKAAGTLPQTRQIHAPTPNHMFGPPAFVQGDVEPFIADHLLLLEFSSRSAIGIELGDGVIQYLIRPADLKAGRFDRVQVVASAY